VGPRRWLDLIRSLGGALLDLLQAEASALRSDLAASGRAAARAIIVLGIAAALLFWAVGAATLALVEVLALWLPRWGATSTVAGVLMLAALVAVYLGRRSLCSLEPPAATVRRHLGDHVAWWQERVLDEGASPEAANPGIVRPTRRPEVPEGEPR
jgi:hypothetical protein